MRTDNDRIKTRIQDEVPPTRLHGEKAPGDLLCPTNYTWTREEYREHLEAQRKRRQA